MNKFKKSSLSLLTIIFSFIILTGNAVAFDEIEVSRTISDTNITTVDTVNITLVLATNQYVEGPSIQEFLPSGWILIEGTDDKAVFKNTTTEWIWAASLDAGEQKVINYYLTVSDNTTDGTYTLSGLASVYEGDDIIIGGDEQIIVTDWNPWNDIDSTNNESITMEELFEAISYWKYGDKLVTDETLDLEKLFNVISSWRYG